MVYLISRALAVLLAKILFRIKVRGKKNIPQKGSFILASNHLSYLDPGLVGVACPRKLNYMARHDLFSNPLFSWWLYKVGVFPVKRESIDSSALKEAIRYLKNGNPLLVFPEGTRGTEGSFLEPQPGIGFLATKADVPVIPAFVKGSSRALAKGAKFIRLHKISVYFGQQIFIERRMPYQEIAQKIMESIRQLSSCEGLS